jgi:hypothetical protein
MDEKYKSKDDEQEFVPTDRPEPPVIKENRIG